MFVIAGSYDVIVLFNNNYQSGQNVPHEEASRLAVESAIKYHHTMKVQNSEV